MARPRRKRFRDKENQRCFRNAKRQVFIFFRVEWCGHKGKDSWEPGSEPARSLERGTTGMWAGHQAVLVRQPP